MKYKVFIAALALFFFSQARPSDEVLRSALDRYFLRSTYAHTHYLASVVKENFDPTNEENRGV